MVKLSQKLPHRSRKYDKISNEERATVIQMKENGSTCREISETLNKNIKTIQSIKSVEKRSEYGVLKKALVNFGYETIMQMKHVDKTNIKKLGKFTKKLIKAQLAERTSNFWNLIPEQKKLSNKRRIIQQIVVTILEKVQNSNQNIDSSQNTISTNIIPKEEEEDPKPTQLIGTQQQLLQYLCATLYWASILDPTKQLQSAQQMK